MKSEVPFPTEAFERLATSAYEPIPSPMEIQDLRAIVAWALAAVPAMRERCRAILKRFNADFTEKELARAILANLGQGTN